MSKRSVAHKSYLAPSDVARMLMVSPATVRLWASRGDLNAVSTPGGHRRFLRHDIEKFARDKDLTMNLPRGDTLRILVVDDDVEVAKFLSRLFKRDLPSAEVRTAHNGFEAGRLVQSFEPQIVLLDLMMPELNGFDVCRQIKMNPATKAIRVIAMTGFYTEENVSRAIDAGAEVCVRKPFDQKQLLKLIEPNEVESVSQAAG